jgi:hypothetical protein
VIELVSASVLPATRSWCGDEFTLQLTTSKEETHFYMTGFGAPLADESGADPRARWAGVARILGPSWAQLPVLTFGLFGVQLMWSVEMSYGT